LIVTAPAVVSTSGRLPLARKVVPAGMLIELKAKTALPESTTPPGSPP
jgi:hypothetical protein